MLLVILDNFLVCVFDFLFYSLHYLIVIPFFHSLHNSSCGFIYTDICSFHTFISIFPFFSPATDGGNPTRSGTSRVNITVINTNDNVPTFLRGSPNASVSEDVAIGTNVVQFNATDEDGGTLSFSIFSGNTDDAFKIDRQTGVLTTNKKLDRETVPRYNLNVTVTDSSSQSSSQNLTVIVLDVNDNTPKFEAIPNVDVTENTAAGKWLNVTVIDEE